MTLKETRQLGIEFERKLQTIDPTTKITNKIDTQDIYAYLNMYQEQYIKQLYTLDQQAQSDTRSSNRIQDILRPLICQDEQLPISNGDRITTFVLNTNYWLFVRASSIVTGTYKNYQIDTEIPNVQYKQQDVANVIDTAFDADRIMRTPIISIAQYNDSNDERYRVIHDKYTNIVSEKLIYIRKPNRFSILNDTACELPMTCFEDLVNGAVDLYFNDKYKLAIASSNARNRAQKDGDNDNTTTA